MIIMIKSNIIQPIPGTRGMKFYPYIRKIDLMSSNSFILSGEDQIAVIDPGALDDQLDCLVENIAVMLNEKNRPVVVYLTHAHLDHCFQLNRLRRIKGLGDIAVAAQEIGADALIRLDSELTLAGLLGIKMAPISVDIKLLSKKDLIIGGALELEQNGWIFSYYIDSFKIRYGPVLHSQTISLGNEDSLEIYSIPGHSPDSLCLRAGSVLFTGDLFFAPNPGMAGAYGWSQSDLKKSIYKIMWILEKKNISFCCPGHGRIVDVDTAWTILSTMYQDVLSLSDLEEITPQWARNTAIYAEDLMRELERLFTIIIGRLAYVSHVLDWLEERGEADGIQTLLDIKQIDELFFEFNRFVPELHRGEKLDWDLVHKAGQIIRKLDQVFESKKLGSFLDRSLLRRANRMLNDYTVTYRGFRPTYYADDVDLNIIINEIIDRSLSKPYEDDAIIDADVHEDYVRELRTRIAYVNLLERATLEFKADKNLPLVRMDKERFTDALMDLMERLPSAGVTEIQIITSSNQGWVSICIAVQEKDLDYLLDEQTWRFFERSFALCGGIIQRYKTSDGSAMEIEFLPCESVFLTC
jgi:glyoxylase-like metal-dependent hydrolase (beta-lactamase superfamily II)